MSMRSAWKLALTAAMSGLLLWSCQAPFSAVPSFGLGAQNENLAAPLSLDWSSQRISSPSLVKARQAHFKTQAYPTANAGWGATGVALTTFGAGATDFASAGPAAAFRTDPADVLYDQVFFLTKNGRFIKVKRSAPATQTALTLGAGKTFSKTYVTLSPASTRAYVLADDGTLYVVNTLTMTQVATVSVSGGYGIAPWLDPYASRHDDQVDVIYVAANNGTVNKYTVNGTPQGAVTAISAATVYNVATGVTPISGTRKVAASPVVLSGVIYLGDQAGNLQVYDTVNAANNRTYALSGPVDTAPAIEVQDGSYSMTDSSGTPVTVANGLAVYAFVTAGPVCSWVNLYSETVTNSQTLRLDDADSSVTYGYLADYNFSTTGTTEYLAAQDGGNINTDVPDRILPNYTTIWSNDYIVPAETNTYDNGTAAAGGPVISYLRWSSTSTVGKQLNRVLMGLEAFATQACRVPEVRTTSYNYAAGTGPWASNALTNSNRPTIGALNVGSFTGAAPNGAGNVTFNKNTNYYWDVSSSIPTTQSQYALALKYNAGGSAVLWPWGPYGGASGKKAKNAAQVESVEFKNNPLNVNTAAAVAGDARPLLVLSYSKATMATTSISTPPVIDAYNKRVYVYYCNTLFSMDYASTAAFSDTDVDATNTQIKHTLFNCAYYGITGNNSNGVSGIKPGATFNAVTTYVPNWTAPSLSLDATAAYVLSRTPSPDAAAPTTWNYAFSKFDLTKMTTGAAMTSTALVASSPLFTGLTGQTVMTGAGTEKEASVNILVDSFGAMSSANVYFGLSNGRIYQFDR